MSEKIAAVRLLARLGHEVLFQIGQWADPAETGLNSDDYHCDQMCETEPEIAYPLPATEYADDDQQHATDHECAVGSMQNDNQVGEQMINRHMQYDPRRFVLFPQGANPTLTLNPSPNHLLDPNLSPFGSRRKCEKEEKEQDED